MRLTILCLLFSLTAVPAMADPLPFQITGGEASADGSSDPVLPIALAEQGAVLRPKPRPVAVGLRLFEPRKPKPASRAEKRRILRLPWQTGVFQ